MALTAKPSITAADLWKQFRNKGLDISPNPGTINPSVEADKAAVKAKTRFDTDPPQMNVQIFF